uniref:Uncharacterized protein n=1 Tax=Candidatus Kentrum sp. FM TaxID=2126340 RepID=A0A450U0W5_9GAMM|nr:MAG: hypothetical protein BECKFM1743C_GA0114222_108362 [Candidatus Kentron sp. FM]VFJ76005.1 MAG: hypothetical protein BECKFM1743A_GA0114220_108932 [Candidatus Kentron sp. FM]
MSILSEFLTMLGVQDDFCIQLTLQKKPILKIVLFCDRRAERRVGSIYRGLFYLLTHGLTFGVIGRTHQRTARHLHKPHLPGKGCQLFEFGRWGKARNR